MTHVFLGSVTNNYLLHSKKKYLLNRIKKVEYKWPTWGFWQSLQRGGKIPSHQRLIVAFPLHMLNCLWTGAGTSLSFTMETNTIPYNMHTHTHWESNYCSIQQWRRSASSARTSSANSETVNPFCPSYFTLPPLYSFLLFYCTHSFF